MNENSTNNNKQQAKQYPNETGYSVPPNYTDAEWEAYLEWNTPKFAAEGTSKPDDNALYTPEYYRKEGKPEWNLVDFPALEPLVRALEYGKSKHGKFSYRNFIPKDILLDKLYRHVIEIHKGNFVDAETGEHHIGGVLANAMFYSYHHRESDIFEVSNRKSDAPGLIDILSDQQKLINVLGYNLAKEQAKETLKDFSTNSRKQEVFRLKSEGKKIREIAKLVGYGERTVYRDLYGK